MPGDVVEEVVDLRRKNQVTWPAQVAKRMEVSEGARLVVSYDPREGVARVRVLPESFAGTLRGTYGATPEEVRAYVRGEQAAWGE